MRDEFSKRDKRILAERVGYKCSFPGCEEATIGPGNAHEKHVLNLGVAAHITAASSGGPRYDPTINQADRTSVKNGIWLCKKHSELIDKDYTQFSADTLRQWKAQAEERAGQKFKSHELSATSVSTLISIGPSIICEAEWLSINSNEWKFRIGDFVIGSRGILIDFAMTFSAVSDVDKYLIFERQGDGRVLEALRIENNKGAFEVVFMVKNRLAPQDPNQIGDDIALLGENFELSFEDGDFRMVTGKDAAKQSMRLILSQNFGDDVSDPFIGSFFSKFYHDYRLDKERLERMLKLEVTRLLAVPVLGGFPPVFEPALPFLQRVISVNVVPRKTNNNQTIVKITGEWGNSELFEEEFALQLSRD
jgi:hypothetical protein